MRLRGITLAWATLVTVGLLTLPIARRSVAAQEDKAAGQADQEVRLRGTIVKLAKLGSTGAKRYTVAVGDMMEIETDYLPAEAGTVFARIEAGTSVAISRAGFRTIKDAVSKGERERRAVVSLEARSAGESSVKVASGRLAETYVIQVR